MHTGVGGRAIVALALAGGLGWLAAGPVAARACSLDNKPSAYADGQLDRVNTQVPTTSAALAAFTPFVFARGYPVRHTITLTENRREVAATLVAEAMRRPWHWELGDGHTAYGWTVRHAYSRPGHYRIVVDCYYPPQKRWIAFDQITLTVRR